jgi:hypothetical protein
MEQKVGSHETTITYPPVIFSTVLLLALVAAIIHAYFGAFVYSGPNSIPMYGIAAIYIVGIGLVGADFRRELWLKVGTVWAVLLVVLWAAAAFLGNAPHSTDLLAYAVNMIEVGLIISLLALTRYSRVQTKS